MKKTILIAATFFMAFAASAQTQAHFGIKAGMNASELHATGADYKTKIGYHAGLLAHIHGRHSQWGIQPEIMYSLEGAKANLVGSNDKQNINLGYLNIPVLVQYMFDNGFRIEAGPQVGFLMNANSKVGSTKKDIKDNLKTTAFSIPVGLGYLTRSGVGFDARYSFGISDLNDVKGGNQLHGNNFQFGLFYQFSDPKVKRK